ncbi:MAG: hypothetical protein H0W89_07885 [Candidatus Levybacteria bacterium]|nr:hypothetical protein [Candidatus Levybacteria bacterium]
MERNESIHPDVLAKMAAWDSKTGRTSRDTSLGPQTFVHRKKIGYALSKRPKGESVDVTKREPGEPMTYEHRIKMGEAIRRSLRYKHR